MKMAIWRRGVVLDEMASLGMITQSEGEAAKAEKLRIIRKQTGRNTYKAPQFVDYVAKQLRDRYGDEVLVSGGLRVYTTLNYKMQQAAEESLRSGVSNTEGCFVAIEPATGYIRAMVGSVDPASHYNRCTQGSGRQPGSSFKAFVYTAAMMEGMKPTDRESNYRVSYPGVAGKRWVPRNYNGRYGGRRTLKQAVAQSINLVAIRVAQRVGIKNVIKYAQAMGITSELEPYLPIAIGGVKGVHPIEMASAYGTFANGGVHVNTSAIVKITNAKGETIDEFTPDPNRVIPENINAEMDDMFRAVVASRGGTGFRAGQIPEARGKTGTTNDDRDAWFIGYVPGKLVAACWVGNDNYAPMHKEYGGLICAPIWVNFSCEWRFPSSRGFIAPTRLRPNPISPRTHKPAIMRIPSGPSAFGFPARMPLPATMPTPSLAESATRAACLPPQTAPRLMSRSLSGGSEPTTYCTIHAGAPRPTRAPRAAPAETTLVTVRVCADSGLLPTPYCPHVVTRRIAVDQVPTQLCNMHTRPR